ncbi:haloacid dehalogenase superfamily, subfamily IA, variant 3 with third motif having DD or ED [Hathewaya proteolytica DSM 3090]|uniref:Haloacid dehalogenase superfamily, subfamily IA, variant 3 with third motif having DD or ED n=1 Tax=Hathewaya proteolytica DSM 3090 TaxID=1121331 RepID=A0A1M6MAY0_9CLOT|nr:HAD family phosphatase [Hathewaya proteolytica]SHJ80606.1 haloacid dehalogenase superfamily, subfamily IA, variant 3 with third motif having DD or ED [Hathewaya proteolytica DSM 3090]
MNKIFDNIKGVIFDMDGTLVDSMWVWREIDKLYLGRHNIAYPENLNKELESLTYEQTAAYFKNRFNLPYTEEEIKKQWNDMSIEQYSTAVPLKPGALKLLDRLQNKGIKISLATSNCRELICPCFNNLGILKYFDAITTSDEVGTSKSFPDIYLKSAEKMALPPEQCIAFEDILDALKGANAAGTKTIAVYDSFSSYNKEEIMAHCSMYIHNFEELL